MIPHLEKFRDFLTHSRLPEDHVKKWEYLQALGKIRYLISEGARRSFFFFIAIAVIALPSQNFTFRELFSREFNWTLSVYTALFFFSGAQNGWKIWKKAEEEYQDAIAEQLAAAAPALAQGQPTPVMRGATQAHVRRP